MNTKVETLQKNLPLILSYLKAEPGSQFNHIYVTPNGFSKKSQIPLRTPAIGLAQFHICYNKIISYNKKDGKANFRSDKINIRVEDNIFNGRLSIFADKAEDLRKADMIIFEDLSGFYISEKNKWGDQEWINDPNFFTQKSIVFPFGIKLINEYNIQKLYYSKKISFLGKYDDKQIVKSFGMPDVDQEFEYFVFGGNYSKEVLQLNNIFLQNDPRKSAKVYYTLGQYRYTNRFASIYEIAHSIINYLPNTTLNAIYQKLQRAKRETNKTGNAIPAVFELSKSDVNKFLSNINNDPDMLIDNKLVVWVSLCKDFDVIENKVIRKTENMKEYMKEYQKEYQVKEETKRNNALKAKVRNWLKRHNDEFNPKWTSEEVEIAKNIIGE